MRLWKPIMSLFVLLCSVYAFNHPEIHWKTVSTEHFTINYYDKTEPSVYATWKIAEETYAALAPLFEYKFRQKIEISLADYDDYSNGWADYTTSSIMIWTPDSRFDYRGSSTWLRNVVSHEITHLLSLENRKKRQLVDVVANVQVSTPNEQLLIQEPFAKITFYPNWLAEGTAQLGSEHLGHDCWDSRREMLLRTAVLSNSLLSLDEMGYFNHDSHNNEMVYNQGFSFVKFLENKVGLSAITSMFKAGAENKIDFALYFAEHTGKTLQTFYSEWSDSLRQHYSVTFPSQSYQEKVHYDKGLTNALPQISPDGSLWGWLSSGRDDNGNTDLIICEKGKTDVRYRIPYAHTAWGFSKDSKKIYFVKSKNPDRNGSYLNDLFLFDIEKKNTTRITNDGRIYDIAISKVNGSLAAVSYNAGVFSLSLLDEKSGKLSDLVKGVQGEPFIKCSWSPTDSTLLIAEKVVNGRSSLFLYSKKDSSVIQFSSGKAREESPFWADDGRIYYSADYSGVFNIYSIKVDGTDLKQYSDAVGGCFTPVLSSDKSILYSGYGKTGFTIASTSGEGYSYGIPSDNYCSFKPLPEPKGKVTIKASPYKPHLGRSLIELQLSGSLYKSKPLFSDDAVDSINYSELQLGVKLYSTRSDPLQKRSMTIGAQVGVISTTLIEDTTSDNISKNITDLIRESKELNNSVKKHHSSNSGEKEAYIQSHFSSEFQRMIAKGASGSDTNSGEKKSKSVEPSIQPFFSFTNDAHMLSYGMDVSASMSIMLLPQPIYVHPYTDWDLTKNLSVGLAAEVDIYPFMAGGFVFGDIPLSLAWSNLGNYNKDLSYNYNDYSQVSVIAGPQFIPVLRIVSFLDYSDTSVLVHNGLFAQAQIFHGFPLGKYATLQLDLEGRIDFYDSGLYDDVLDSVSKTYVQTSTGLNFVFPLVRNINSGAFYYFDAFYGSIGYSLLGKVNGEFFDSKNYSRKLLTDTGFTETARIGHVISASLVLGHYKSYQFFKKLVVEADYELLRRKLYLSISSGF
jgi:Tol biopolymer transport system component